MKNDVILCIFTARLNEQPQKQTCECFVTQCLRTLTTRMVDTLLVIEHFRLAASLKASLLRTEKLLFKFFCIKKNLDYNSQSCFVSLIL
jgi:hypothetical protein